MSEKQKKSSYEIISRLTKTMQLRDSKVALGVICEIIMILKK